MERRNFLATGTVSLTIGLSGCLNEFAASTSSDNSEIPETKSEQGEADPLTSTSEISPDDTHDAHDEEEICLIEASEAVFKELESELGDSFDESKSDASQKQITSSVSSNEGVVVTMSSLLSQEGDLIRTPKTDFENVVEAAPESVTMTVTIDGEEHECYDEVTVIQEVEQQD